MNETKPPLKCQYCGKEMNRGLTMHERNCKLNPINAPKPEELKQVYVVPDGNFIPADKDIEPAEAEHPLVITDVQPSLCDPETDDLPWFEDANGNRKAEPYTFIGSHENIPCALVMTVYGRLVPAYLVPGFIGMFPKYYEFPEIKQDEQPREEQPINASGKPIISPLEEEKFEQVITQEPIHAQTEKKKSLFGRILGKKEKAAETRQTSTDLAKKIIDVQGGAI